MSAIINQQSVTRLYHLKRVGLAVRGDLQLVNHSFGYSVSGGLSQCQFFTKQFEGKANMIWSKYFLMVASK